MVGAELVTSTVTLTSPTSILIRADPVLFSSTGKFFKTAALKPGAVVLTLYMPTVRLVNRNSPLSLVVVANVWLVSRRRAITLALGITRPGGATTLPAMSPSVG